ncbi:MAG: IS110 family transposase [Candidatus Aegiribacteria sp.]|nr:IS110 family transposase [Candidatus Aegiribacteria sp.]
MRFYTTTHQHYCGIDLHARVMYLCIISSDGEIVLHRNMKADPESLLKAIEPYRPDVVVGVECIFTWYWVADLCAEEGIPFVLGHALYMKAIHGGKAKNDRIDSGKIAAMLKGGMFPMAYVYPAKMRATRDLLRRRNYLVRKRADLITHVQNTNSQYNQPEFGMNITYKCNREEVLSHFKDPNVYMSMKVNLDLIDQFTVQIRAMEKHVLDNAKNHDPQSLYLMQTIYGIGKVLSLTILYEIGDISRFPRVQEFASYSRLVKCSRESAGKRYGTAGSKIGNVHLKWAFSEASVMFLKENPEGMKYKKQLERKHGKAKSLSILAHKLGRAAYYMLKRNRAFDMNKFLSA